MVNNQDFYIFEVLENHEDKPMFSENVNFNKGDRFIGWEWKEFNQAVKGNFKELECIPMNKVKKIYKIRFEEMEE